MTDSNNRSLQAGKAMLEAQLLFLDCDSPIFTRIELQLASPITIMGQTNPYTASKRICVPCKDWADIFAWRFVESARQVSNGF